MEAGWYVTPRVSILVPCFNGASYISECLESILQQTHCDFEVVVVDDASRDGTRDIAEEFARVDARVRVFDNSVNLGLVPNWNRALGLARGEWVKFVFQDDSIQRTCLEDLLTVAADTGCPLVFGRRDFMFEGGLSSLMQADYLRAAKEVEELFPVTNVMPAKQFCRLVLERGDRNFIGEPVTVLFKRDLIERVGLFNPDLIVFCDMEYWMRIGVNFGIAHAAKNVASFRVHAASATARSLATRRYRMFVLDHVLTSHEFAFKPAFAALRAEAAEVGLDLRAQFGRKVAWAHALASNLSDVSGRAGEPLMREWQAAERTYPRLRSYLSQKRRRDDLRRLSAALQRLFGAHH